MDYKLFKNDKSNFLPKTPGFTLLSIIPSMINESYYVITNPAELLLTFFIWLLVTWKVEVR